MNKFLVSLVFFMGFHIFAGPVQDIKDANRLIEQNKLGEAISLLEKSKPVKGEEDAYEFLNTFLGENQEDINKAKKYFEIASSNKDSISDGAIVANGYLYILEQDQAKKKNLENEYILRIENLTKKEIQNTSDDDKKALIYFNNAQKISTVTGNKKTIEYISKGINITKNNVIKSIGYNALGQYYLKLNDSNMADKYFKSAVALNPELDTYYVIARLYLSVANNNKAYEYLLQAHSKFGDSKTILLDLCKVGSLIDKNIDKYISILKKEYKMTDFDLASEFFYNGAHDLGINYANKSIKNEKNSTAYAILVDNSLRLQNYDDALKYANVLKKAKIEGADQLIKQIEFIRNNKSR